MPVYQLHCWCCGEKTYPDDAVVGQATGRIFHPSCLRLHHSGPDLAGHICVADR